LMCAAAIGPGKDFESRAQALAKAQVDVFVVDTAHGHSQGVLQSVRFLRQSFTDIPIIAGNIVTPQAAIDLANAGTDGVKVGVGPGSICTTRIVAGVGVPQFSAIYNVSRAVRDKDIFIVADGGVKYSGDIVKALAAGAHAVMIGSLFAGSKEAPGEQILYQGRAFKGYRGMGSMAAMSKGSKERYGQADESENEKLVPEGIEGRIPYKGPLEQIVYQLCGGLRAGMGYVGAQNIADLQEKAQFVRITASGLRESHVHDVVITKEEPNYWLRGE